MKRLWLTCVIILSSLAATATCFAQGYVSGNIGAVMVEDADLTATEFDAAGLSGVEVSFDTGVGFTLAVGADTGPIRLEGEFSYRTNDMDELSATKGNVSASGSFDGEIESMALLGNVFFDIETNSPVKPFIGGGIGFSNLDMELLDNSEDDTVFAYQFIVGTGFQVNDATTIDISYRYFATAAPEFEGIESEFASHNLLAGVRFIF